MSVRMHACDAKEWSTSEFFSAELGHGARNKRAMRIGERLIRAPWASIPKFSLKRSEAKATYAFMSNPEVTHEGLLSGHQRNTMRACAAAERVLVIEDTTAVSFGSKNCEDLGPVNDQPGVQGMLVHTALAVAAKSRCVLGVLHQQVWVRSKEKKPRHETAEQRRGRPRESERWPETIDHVAKLWTSHDLDASRVVHVADRECDVFEAFEACDRVGHSFVIRATHNRLLTASEAGEEREYGLDAARAARVVAHKEVRVPSRGSMTARVAKLEIRAARVEVRPPKNRGREGAPQWMNVVLVEEVGGPTGKQRLTWFLLTREPIATEADVLAIVGYYEARWLIEEFHMGLKTGCAIEERQLESLHALSNFLAFATITACKLLQLRDASRSSEPRLASEVLTPTQLLLLRRAEPKLSEQCSARQALRAIATLGGFYGSNKNAMPGWRTLALGFQLLLEREVGYLEAIEMLGARTPSHSIEER
jgi:hypothetical protein